MDLSSDRLLNNNNNNTQHFGVGEETAWGFTLTCSVYVVPELEELHPMIVRSHNGVGGRGHFFMKRFLAGGLDVVDQSTGPYIHLTSHPRFFFLFLSYVKDCV